GRDGAGRHVWAPLSRSAPSPSGGASDLGAARRSLIGEPPWRVPRLPPAGERAILGRPGDRSFRDFLRDELRQIVTVLGPFEPVLPAIDELLDREQQDQYAG